jgi:ABC-type phosphate transport system substrate-binding protein
VVNKAAGIFNLTSDQLRDIFLGKITNWKQLHGNDKPISIVARTSSSGTRRAFDNYVIGANEAAQTSYDCINKNAGPNPKADTYTRCEVPDTPTLLKKVDSIDGAIGYAQVSDASGFRNMIPISINGEGANKGDVEAGSYNYWTVEWLYTAGEPAPGSLEAKFLDYMATTTASDILQQNQYVPCIDQGVKQALCDITR